MTYIKRDQVFEAHNTKTEKTARYKAVEHANEGGGWFCLNLTEPLKGVAHTSDLQVTDHSPTLTDAEAQVAYGSPIRWNT